MASGQEANDIGISPEKRARGAVRRALLNGDLVRLPCEVCSDKNSHAHHDDYSKPLDVRWLCADHHADEHEFDPLLNGNRVHRARIEAGYSQSELASVIGCSTRTIQGWEAGRPVRPHPRFLRALAAATGREPAWFLGGPEIGVTA